MSEDKTTLDDAQRDGVAIPRTYTNAAHLSHNIYDFQFIFGTSVMLPNKDPNEIVIVPSQLIYMSPQHAKRFFKVLGEQITKYEAAFGTIQEVANTEPEKTN